jgi:DNA-binding NtrC family response regulator
MSRDDVPDDQRTVPRSMPALPGACRFVITVTSGGAGRFEIDATHPSPLLIGQSELCELRLADPTVSRRHASMEVVGERLRLRDLGSTNGTWIDGVAIVEVCLTGTTQVRVGNTVLRVDRGEPSAALSIGSANRFGSVLGGSQAMRRLHPLCARLAASQVPVVIEGETGVGKEQLAESLHTMGPRGAGPFVVFDCTAVAPSLIESELFGHERGAFTGSVTEHAGVFERAHGGTLLIDEIGDMPLDLQPKLLRAIERLSITRVGGRAPRQVDVRVLAATRRDLDREVQLGRFRDDLFHRLAVARIELPPLRARHGDVELLARHFWVGMGGDPELCPDELLRAWEDYAWPGNVRELRNAVARRLALGDLVLAPEEARSAPTVHAMHGVLASGDAIGAVLALDLPLNEARQRVVDEFEQRYVLRLIELSGGNMGRAAAAAGVARRHFRRLKSKFMQDDDGGDDDS